MRRQVPVIGATHEDEVRLMADAQAPESISPAEDVGRGGGEGVQSLKRGHPVLQTGQAEGEGNVPRGRAFPGSSWWRARG